MTWDEIITISRQALQENTAAHFTAARLKGHALEAQRELSNEIADMFPYKRTFTSVASQAEYAFETYLGSDIKDVTRVAYDTTENLNVIQYEQLSVSVTGDGTPTVFYVRDDYLGLWQQPSSALTVTVWGNRVPAKQAISLYVDSTYTSATAAVSSTGITLAMAGGSWAGATYTFASFGTIASLTTVITSDSSSTVTITNGDIYTSDATSKLEIISASSFQAVTLDLYYKPECPTYSHIALPFYIAYRAMEEDEELELANNYLVKWQMHVERLRKINQSRKKSNKLARVGDRYGYPNHRPTNLTGSWAYK